MKRFMMLALFLVACSGGGDGGGSGATAEAHCEDAAATLCDRFFACLPANELEAAGFGTSVSTCTEALKQRNQCATQAASCPDGQTFHPDQADDCISEIGALTCSQLMGDVTANAPACSKVCAP